MSKESRSERGKPTAANEKFVAKMKEMLSTSTEVKMEINGLWKSCLCYDLIIARKIEVTH